MSVNKVILIGNLGADPEVRTAGSGQVANLRLATGRKWTDKDGNEMDATEWHTVVLWNKLAELAERYLRKGRQVYIEGRIQTRDWIDQKTGEKRYKTEIVGHQMTFLGGGDERQAQPRNQDTRRSYSKPQRQAPPTGAVGPKSNPYADDEIPF